MLEGIGVILQTPDLNSSVLSGIAQDEQISECGRVSIAMVGEDSISRAKTSPGSVTLLA